MFGKLLVMLGMDQNEGPSDQQNFKILFQNAPCVAAELYRVDAYPAPRCVTARGAATVCTHA